MAAVISLPVCDPRTQASGEQSVKAKLRHPFRRVPGRPRGGRNFVWRVAKALDLRPFRRAMVDCRF
jgi:hypothetical protein